MCDTARTKLENTKKPLCKYGSNCYRKAKTHLQAFSHDVNDELDNAACTKKVDLDASDSSDDIGRPAPKKVKRSHSSDLKCPETEGTSEVSHSPPSKRTKISTDRHTQEEKEIVKPQVGDISDAMKSSIKEKFLMEMPQDFYDFWVFARSLNHTNPSDAFQLSLGLRLVGPYDVLAGKCNKSTESCYLRHWRYYYDPPEFQTIIRGDDNSQFHMGYYRDDPKQMPEFVASNAAAENCLFAPRGTNIFAAVKWYITDRLKQKGSNKKLTELAKKLQEAADEGGYTLELNSQALKSRNKRVVCKTFHGAGIVVPIDEHGVGYRPLPETDADLKKILKKIVGAKTSDDINGAMDQLMEIIMLVQFANDESDYGQGLELGIDLFCYGGEVLHKTILNILPLAYQFLGRKEFADIIKAHLVDRKKTIDLSVL